ncbi:MAG TPA: hypothetical protein VMV92_38390 [Streptosporangiaceae bacterium]|nr:hypothetical protein [Streptosporangiaceae bacterium]
MAGAVLMRSESAICHRPHKAVAPRDRSPSVTATIVDLLAASEQIR